MSPARPVPQDGAEHYPVPEQPLEPCGGGQSAPREPRAQAGKFLPKISKRRGLDPLTRQELAQFLAYTKAVAPILYPLFLCAARTGLRQGELLALQWDDVNLTGRFLEVRRNFTHGRLTTPKSGDSRRVDLSRKLTATLEALQLDRQLDAATHGQDAAPPWVFCDRQGKPFHQNWVRLRFFRLLKGAGVRQVRFHDLRHTFASLLLQNGESAVYVKDQMGHCSIQVTVDLLWASHSGREQTGGRPSGFRCRRTVVEARICNPGATGRRVPGGHIIGSAAISGSYEEGGMGWSDGFRTRDLRIHNPAL